MSNININVYDTNPFGPNDVPEGAAVVIVSATLFQQWINDHAEITIESWGDPVAKDGVLVYSPTISRV